MFVLAGACGGEGKSAENGTEPPAINLLVNGSLETGREPWYTLVEESGFAVTDARWLSGTHSALESMRDPVGAVGIGPTDSKVYYLVQDISPSQFPDIVRGNYFVDNWVKGTRWQYLQFVIIVFAPANFPAEPSNYQIRYPLAGIDSEPFPISNAKFQFVSKEEPLQGKWVPFEVNVKEGFEELWGDVPEGFEKLRLLFEVRWDHGQEATGLRSADVFWDDLYAGPG
jgi:hypothetical protein